MTHNDRIRAALEQLVDSATLGHSDKPCALCADIEAGQDALAAAEVAPEYGVQSIRVAQGKPQDATEWLEAEKREAFGK